MTERMLVRNITEQHDFTTVDARDNVCNTVSQPGDVVFYSSPCTGGSPRQRMNAARASRNGCSRFCVRLAGHLTLHKRLWKNFVTVIEH
eukprot:1042267-Lingulodinium_polyedra.AAC.1